MNLVIIAAAKIADNALSTVKTILIQRNKGLLAGISVMISSFLYFYVVKNVVSNGSNLTIFIVAVASGIGCGIATKLSYKFSKDRTFVNIVMSDNRDAIKDFRDFLAEYHITNVATDSYLLDWEKKTITVTAYANTKEESQIIDNYFKNCPIKFKRVIQKIN